MTLPAAGDVATLVRLPAVLSVPGDALLGAALAGRTAGPRTLARCGASGCLYLAGMALNDYADREVDARERPGRPIPAGRVTPRFALALSAGLTGAGLALAASTGGRGALSVALPLAGAVWGYDLGLKRTAAGPAAMAACRGLDVLLGAAGERGWPGVTAAVPGAVVVAGHTLAVTELSRGEVDGGSPAAARRALRATAAVTAGAIAVALPRLPAGTPRRRGRAVLAASLLGAYAARQAQAQRRAVNDPSPAAIQAAVGTGVLGLMPLEAGMLAAAGPLPAAAAVAGAWPVARGLARRRSVT